MTEKSKQIVILFIILAFAFIIRMPFLEEPLDRDSAIFGFFAHMHNQGYLPYKDFLISRPPGTHSLFSILFNFFNPTDILINLFVICWGTLNTLLVFLLSMAIFSNFWVSAITAILYGLFSSSPFIEGTGVMTENFMVTFNILGIYYLIKAEERKKIWLLLAFGLCFGIAFMFKQTAIVDYSATLVYLFMLFLFNEQKITYFLKKIIISTVAFVTPLLACLIYFNYKGVLKEFISECFIFNFKYIKLLGYNVGNYWEKFFYFNLNIFKTNSLLWIGAVAFITFLLVNLFLNRAINKKFFKENKSKFLLALWGIFSFIGLCGSARFFPHYYIAILPSFVLMAGFIFVHLLGGYKKTINKAVILICVILSIGISIYFHYDYYLKFSPEEISMHKYDWEPFVEAKQVGLYIGAKTKTDDYIFVWAEEPEIHFYSMRNSVCNYHSNTVFIYYRSMYPDAEEVLLSSLRKKQPVFFVVDTRYLSALKKCPAIYEYVAKNYYLDKEFKVIRHNLWGYSLLTFKLGR